MFLERKRGNYYTSRPGDSSTHMYVFQLRALYVMLVMQKLATIILRVAVLNCSKLSAWVVRPGNRNAKAGC